LCYRLSGQWKQQESGAGGRQAFEEAEGFSLCQGTFWSIDLVASNSEPYSSPLNESLSPLEHQCTEMPVTGMFISYSSVPRRPLPVCLQFHLQTTSSLCQPRSYRRASPSSRQLWSAGSSVAGPAIWNWLSDSLRDSAISRDSFKLSLKTFLFAAYSCIQCIRAFWTMLSTNLLTYLHQMRKINKC